MEKMPVYKSHVETALQQLNERADELTARHSCRETVQVPNVDRVPGVAGLAGMTLCFVREKPTDAWTLDANRHTLLEDVD